MLLGITAVGEEALAGWQVETRPASLIQTTAFTLNIELAAPTCNVDLTGEILQLDSPLSVDVFARGQEFSDIMTGQAQCIGLDDELSLPCFPTTEEIGTAPTTPGLEVPAATRLNAETGLFGLSGQVVTLTVDAIADNGLISNVAANVVFKMPETSRISNVSGNVIFQQTQTARVSNVSVDVIFANPELSIMPAAGSFVLSGQDVTLIAQQDLTAAQGSFTLTGQDATLTRSAQSIAPEAGMFTFEGEEATLARGYDLVAEQGSFTLTGYDLLRGRSNTGTFTLTGQDSGLTVDYDITAAQGSFTLSGQDVVLDYKSRDIIADQGSFTLTGGTVASAPRISNVAAEVIYQPTETARISNVTAEVIHPNNVLNTGRFTLSGQDVTLTYSGA